MTRYLLKAIFLTIFSQSAWCQTVTFFCTDHNEKLPPFSVDFTEASGTVFFPVFGGVKMPYKENSRYRAGSETVDVDFGVNIYWFIFDKWNGRLVTQKIFSNPTAKELQTSHRRLWDCSDG